MDRITARAKGQGENRLFLESEELREGLCTYALEHADMYCGLREACGTNSIVLGQAQKPKPAQAWPGFDQPCPSPA